MPTKIYHICKKEEWKLAEAKGVYTGSSQDEADGFIHFSNFSQIIDSAKRHRAGQSGLVLLSVDPGLLLKELRWEPSRRGELFPHLYGNLQVNAVSEVYDLPLGTDGKHIFPNAWKENFA